MSNASFQGAHNFLLNHPQFAQTVNQTINVAAGSGLGKLLKASMPGAFHDCGSRDPPRCHPGTRLDYIDKILKWGSGDLRQHPERVLWMEGPAGVGKSAVAQSCAELLAERNQLGAAFFFSRPNQRDDPKRLFPSLSYQITTISDEYANSLDRKLQRNPNLLEKSLAGQFHELLVKPLAELQEGKEDLKDHMIIIDGLDECAGIKAQQEIIEIVAKSVQDASTPFTWAFFSRPESHIVASFTSDRVYSSYLHLELPVSRDIDHEILCYLSAELKRIREERGLPSSWPSEKDLGTLVDRSGGLYIYASMVVRFIGQRNSLGPIHQLHLILTLPKLLANNANSGHPLSELDLFYILILRCVPSNVFLLLLKILLLQGATSYHARHVAHGEIYTFANSLGLSELEILNVCAALSSVLKLHPTTIQFYHTSFMDFLRDPERSEEFCIYGACLDAVRQDLLERLNRVHAQSKEKLTFDLTWSFGEEGEQESMYGYLVNAFFRLCSYPRPLPSSTAAGLVKFRFLMVHRLYLGTTRGGGEIDAKALRQNIPIELRDKVIRQGHNPLVYLHKSKRTKRGEHYVLGQGRDRVVLWPRNTELSNIIPYPSIFKF